MNRIPSVRWIIYAIATTFVLGGCSLFHHRENDSYYSKARETRSLEVPPDLDTPPTSDELVIPNTNGSPGAAASGGSASTASSVSMAPGAMVIGQSLQVSDNVADTWRRVGTALEQANVGTIGARDESAHTYTLQVDDLHTTSAAAAPSERHWYTAIWHRIQHPLGGKKSGMVSGDLVITVAAEGDGSRVDVQGPSGVDASAATQRVLQALRSGLAAGSAGETASSASSPAAMSVEGGLHLADTVEHTWQRVGLALERGKIGTISARDDANHTYTLDVENLTVKTVQRAADQEPKEQHWYSAVVDRILYPTGHHDKVVESAPVSGKVLVKVISDGDGAKVEVESASGTESSEVARRVLQVLQTRLG